MINKIKSKIASKKLKEIHFSRNVSFKSFEEIKSIGIVYVYNNSIQEELRLARLFIEDMKKQGIFLKIILLKYYQNTLLSSATPSFICLQLVII